MEAKILHAYETIAERYDALIDQKPHNAYYDLPNTLSLLPEVGGKRILDAACGPGKYAEILIAQGAEVHGFDFSPKMVEKAQQRTEGKGHFWVQDLADPLKDVANESFDIVLCALALHYIQDWNPTIQEFNRVLKPGGILVISIEHPFFEYLEYKSEHYFEQEPVKCIWRGFGIPVEVNSYRRSMGDCITPLTQNGFLIEQFLEPKPTPEFEKADPKHFKELSEFPSFLCIKALKRS